MPRAKDAKVWNEDLVTALRSREEQCRRTFSQRQYLWRDGATAIASIRKDIYQFKTGKIVGLPRTLTKCVEEECRAIIEGTRPLLPEGYIPATLEEQGMSRGFDTRQRPNPYHDDPYLKRIKMRGGSYAILMAFHFSETETMTQKQICTAAQNYCDEEMEPNFYSGRSYGAWSSKKTLVKHGLIKESRTTQMGRKGHICNGVFEYTITENGKLFVDALLQKFPQHPNTPKENHRSATSFGRFQNEAKDKLKTEPLQVKSENIKHSIERHVGYKNIDNAVQSNPKTNTMQKNEILLSDSDDDDDELSSKLIDESNKLKQQPKASHTTISSNSSNVIDLVDSSDEELSLPDLDVRYESKKIAKEYENVSKKDNALTATNKPSIHGPKLVILIDNRERNHNATPRYMRIELSRHLAKSSGSLKKVWPSYLPLSDVEEDVLNYGDFAFMLERGSYSGKQRLPLTIERKRISDLVQRSSQAHHWRQLHRMRDCCEHAILLIEGNTKKTSNFISYEDVEREESWNPDHHTIDDEHAFYRFLGRAILSSPVLKIIQAKDEQASYRAIGATGLIASLLPWEKNAPKSVPSTKVNLNKLYNKLKSRGIPWQIARRISEELGSIQQLNNLYGNCEASARPSILVPSISEACSSMIEKQNSRSLLEYGTVERWSSAIHSAWYSEVDDHAKVITSYEENKYFANDRAQLLNALHRGRSVQRAVREANKIEELSLKDTRGPMRKVRIESSAIFSQIFPTDVKTETFYESTSVEENPLGLILPSVVMQTSDGNFQSNKLVICVIEGSNLFQRIQDSIKGRSSDDYVERSKTVAKQVNEESSSFLICPKKDRRVLLIRGLGAAMSEAAKLANYRSECRVLVDLVAAELMLQYNTVVIHAPRRVNDLEMILREFAMACFYYQLTTRKLR